VIGATTMWISLGFFTMGLLVGNLAGLSATSVVSQIIGLFFALAGGSVIAFLKGLEKEEQKMAGQAMLSASAGALLGIYVGVLVVQFRLLSPSYARVPVSMPAVLPAQGGNRPPSSRSPDAQRPVSAPQAPVAQGGPYLRGSTLVGIVENSNAIHTMYLRGGYSAKEAYEKTYELIHGGYEE
jgi:hypothetical protein